MNLSIAPIASRDIYDGFLNQNSPDALFQSWLWGEVLIRQGKKVARLGMWEEKQLVGIFQTAQIDARRGKFLHVRHGPVFTKQSQEYWKQFVYYMQAVASSCGAWFIRVSPLIAPSLDTTQTFKSLGFVPAAIHAMDAEHCWVLDLDASEQELLAGMRKTTRYEIRKAQKNDIRVLPSTEVNDLHHFNRLYETTAKRHGFVGHSEIREEFEVFTKQGQALLLLAKQNESILAAALILFQSKQAIYHHGASLDTKTGASYLIQWEAIREAKKRGLARYNFWGIAPTDDTEHPWQGLTLFKKGFGGHAVDYVHAQDLPVSPLYLFSRTIEKIRKATKGY